MKNFLLYILLLTTLSVSAKKKESEPNDTNVKTMVTVGIGSSKSEATTLALKQAIEQAFGTFVSSNTTIINDELTKDEIVSVSSGNIRKYTELASAQIENNKWSVTLESVVSISKLVKIAQSKGDACELAGNVLAQQIKYNLLLQKNAQKVVENMYVQLKSIAPTCYDKKISVSPKIVKDRNVNRNMMMVTINFVPNQNAKVYNSIRSNTLKSLALNNTDGINTIKICDYSQNIRRNVLFEIPVVDLYDDVAIIPNFEKYLVEDNIGNKFPLVYYKNYGRSGYKPVSNSIFLFPISKEPWIFSCHILDKSGGYDDDPLSKEYKYLMASFPEYESGFSYELSLDELEKFSKIELTENTYNYYPYADINSVWDNCNYYLKFSFDENSPRYLLYQSGNKVRNLTLKDIENTSLGNSDIIIERKKNANVDSAYAIFFRIKARDYLRLTTKDMSDLKKFIDRAKPLDDKKMFYMYDYNKKTFVAISR